MSDGCQCGTQTSYDHLFHVCALDFFLKKNLLFLTLLLLTKIVESNRNNVFQDEDTFSCIVSIGHIMWILMPINIIHFTGFCPIANGSEAKLVCFAFFDKMSHVVILSSVLFPLIQLNQGLACHHNN